MSIISKTVRDREILTICCTLWVLETLYRILTAGLNFSGEQKCLISEWLILYMLHYHVPSGVALRRIDTILVGSRTSHVKITCRKSCPVDVFQVPDLFFHPCFKVQLGDCIERAFSLPSHLRSVVQTLDSMWENL